MAKKPSQPSPLATMLSAAAQDPTGNAAPATGMAALPPGTSRQGASGTATLQPLPQKKVPPPRRKSGGGQLFAKK